jgi:proton-coupled amino acid transporter
MAGTIAHHIWGKRGRVFVDTCLCLTQAGFVVGYLIFLSDTIVHLVATVVPLEEMEGNTVHSMGMWCTVAAVMCISMFRDVASLGWTSIIASVAVVGSALVVMAKTSFGWRGTAPDVVAFKWDTLPVFFGIVVNAFEGIGCLLPIDNAMSGDFAGSFPRVLNAVMAVVPAFLGFFGLLHYMALGSNTPQIILHVS